MNFIKKIIKETQIGGPKKKILFIDGEEPRSIKAAQRHIKNKIIEPVLLLEKSNPKLEKKFSTLVMENWKTPKKKQELIKKYIEKRKGKETEKDAKRNIFEKNYFSMLMLELGEVDGVIGGLVAPTAAILRPAFKLIGPKKGVRTISSVMIMFKKEEWYIFSDISVNILPTSEQLAEIAKNAYDFAKCLSLDTRIAFLSFSTYGSAIHEKSLLVQKAKNIFENTYKMKALGEIQFDAAFDVEVRRKKCKETLFNASSTIYIFPNLDSGNIGYKIAQRMGGYGAIGPIITGIAKPINDLSRGATVDDVYNTALLTALQVEK